MKTPKLKVAADPVHAGKHPLHDHRFIVTEDCELIADKNDIDELEWFCTKGSVIAEMRDCDDQAELARLFAASPSLLEHLENCVRELSHWNHWAATTRAGYIGSTGEETTCGIINAARDAIRKATGKP